MDMTMRTYSEDKAFTSLSYYSIEEFGIITAIDDSDQLVDLLSGAKIIYTLKEAQELVDKMKELWPNYDEDPYYGQGDERYPISVTLKDDVKYIDWNGVKIYTTVDAGERVYGIKGSAKKTVQGPMDFWENWASDRKAMVKDYYEIKYK